MTTIADIATNFISQSKGVSPMGGLVKGVEKGMAMKSSRAKSSFEAEKEANALTGRRKTLALAEDRFTYEKQQDLSALAKDEREIAQRENFGMGMAVVGASSPETALTGLQKGGKIDPALTIEDLPGFLAENDVDGKMGKFTEFQRKQAETERHNVAMEEKKGGTSISFDEAGNPVISIGDTKTVPKGAQTGLFKEVIASQQGLDAINQIESLYEPEFLSYGGAVKGAYATFLNKMDPEKKSQFQQRRAAFISAANKEFLRFRKWATGVAGGEKEMAEIKRATFSEDDSPQDFEVKLNLGRSLQRRFNARSRAALASGVNNQKAFKEYIKANPLDEIPTLQQRGDTLLEMGYDKEQIKEILSQEGYV